MTQRDKAELFGRLHIKGDPLILYNVWDAGSAAAVAAAGAPAIATGSWSVAAAQGYGDGEQIPLDLLVTIAGRIAASIDLPCSIDYEGGFATAPADVAANVGRLIEAGAIGINFEDRIIGGEGLHAIGIQCARIRAIRTAADAADLPFFINARTDLFLKAPLEEHAAHIDEAIERAGAYADAGASGFFAPALADPDLISKLCAASKLPVNIMVWDSVPPIDALARLGVARVSYGPAPYRDAMQQLETRAASLYQA